MGTAIPDQKECIIVGEEILGDLFADVSLKAKFYSK